MIMGSGNIKCLIENRNLAICVADIDVPAVVVVSTACKLCFRYTGPSSTPRDSFHSRGITTDSGANILMSDYNNYRIHILDRDARFLRLIQNCVNYSFSGVYMRTPEISSLCQKQTNVKLRNPGSGIMKLSHLLYQIYTLNLDLVLTETVNLNNFIKQLSKS